jgi:4a-hydroxytetrahydrobiopterin dehydratase
MNGLAEQKCKPCEGGVKPLSVEQANKFLATLDAGWSLSDDGKSIFQEYRFAAFARTIAFVNAVAWVATTEGHHPDMQVSYGSCVVCYTTHAIDGLSDNDFICAAKIDRLAADAF